MKVSILIPAYNVADYVAKCLDSILHQTHTDLQIVIVNDGSTDNTLKILREYALKDERIEVYTQVNKGVAATRNKLLSKAKGDAILFIDADDWVELDMIATLVGLLVQNDADIAMCQIMRNNDFAFSDITTTILKKQESVKRFLFHKELTGSLCNKLIRISLLHHLRFREDVSYGEDALMLWNVLKNSEITVVTSQQFYHYRVNENSISHASFGKNKLSAYLVWDEISKETDALYPEFTSLAHAQFCHQMNMLLFDAACCGYSDKSEIDKLRQVVKRNLKYLKNAKISNTKKLVFARIVSYSYKLATIATKLLYR